MTRQLFWKLCFIFATGIVALFYFINQLTIQTEEGMSMLAIKDRQTITQWGKQAQALYKAGDMAGLQEYVDTLKVQENTWVSIVSFNYQEVTGDKISQVYTGKHTLGRSVDWKIHLYFDFNPVMEIPFDDEQASFLIQLPDRMRPGAYWQYMHFILQIIIPTLLLGAFAYLLYRYIMKPLSQLQTATNAFSDGDLTVRATQIMGKRNDEFSQLAKSFDEMASQIGEQIISQRQLIADLSHELRTPLTRLDIAVAAANDESEKEKNIHRISRESRHIRKLVEDSLSLAWLENEKPELQQEMLDLVDLLDVLIADAKFEFPDRKIIEDIPETAVIEDSSHRAVGQAIENILRNALRYTPRGEAVTIEVHEQTNAYFVVITDKGPGVPEALLETIFKPFFRVDKSRERDGSSFGLGLALAQRQLATIRGTVVASNNEDRGLTMTISLPKRYQEHRVEV